MSDSILSNYERDEWALRDAKIRCHNVQNKITPYEVKETKLNARMRKIKKRDKVDEYEAWERLYKELKQELREVQGNG